MCSCTRVFNWVDSAVYVGLDLQRPKYPVFATYTDHTCLAHRALILNSAGFILWPLSCPQCIGARGIFTDCMPLITNQLVPMQRQVSRCHNVICCIPTYGVIELCMLMVVSDMVSLSHANLLGWPDYAGLLAQHCSVW